MRTGMMNYLRAWGMAAVLVCAARESPAQTHFNNGSVSFDLPKGWHAETRESDGASVMLTTDGSADAIYYVFDGGLPRELNAVERVMEARALSVMNSLHTTDPLTIERHCTASERGDLSGRQATRCAALVHDKDGNPAYLWYTAVPLDDTTCLIIDFAPADKDDFDKIKAAEELLTKTFSFVATKAQFAPTQDGAWQTYNAPDYSFQYPLSWKLQTNPARNEAWAQDNVGRTVSVRFVAGAQNRADTFNQCASEDEMLTQIYKADYEWRETSKAQYPYTSVTHDNYMYGFLGGKETWVSITHVEAWNKPASVQVWINVVPRAGGMYVVTYTHPSESMEVSEPLRKTFAKSIVFKSGPLDKKAYCNYLGQ